MRTDLARVMTVCAALSFAAAVSAQTSSNPQPSPTIKPQPVPPAATPQPAPVAASQTVIQGRDFGQHVSGMAPEHPKQHGAMFGECVSELAKTGVCPHHEEEAEE